MAGADNKNKISGLQLFFLTFLFIYSGTLQCADIYRSGRCLWLAVTVGCAIGMTLMLCYTRIAACADTAACRSLDSMLRFCFGDVGGRCISLFFGIYFIFRAAICLRSYSLFWHTSALPDTAWQIFAAILLLVCIYACRLGLKAVGRLSELLVLLIPSIIVVLLFSSDMGCTDSFLPLLEGGGTAVISGAVPAALVPFGDCVLFLAIFDHAVSKASGAATPRANAVASASSEELCSIPLVRAHHGIRARAFLFGGALAAAAFILGAVRDQAMIGPIQLSMLKYPADFSVQLIGELNIEPLLELNMSAAYAIRIILLLFGGKRLISSALPRNIRRRVQKHPHLSSLTLYSLTAAICFINASECKPLIFTANMLFPTLILFILTIKTRGRAKKGGAKQLFRPDGG